MSSKLVAPAALIALASAVSAEPAGPPVSKLARQSPAEQAIALYKARYGPRPSVKPCPAGGGWDIVVCGRQDGAISPFRVPLPDERGPRDWARQATGEAMSPKAAMTAADLRCSGMGCGGDGPLDLKKLATTAVELAAHMADPDR